MDAKLKIATAALSKITTVPRAEFDMTTVATIAQTALCDIDAIAPPAAAGSVDTLEFCALLELYGRMYPQGDMARTARAKEAIMGRVATWGAQQYEAGYKHVEDGAYRAVVEEARKLAERLEQSEAALAIALEVVALHQS